MEVPPGATAWGHRLQPRAPAAWVDAARGVPQPTPLRLAAVGGQGLDRLWSAWDAPGHGCRLAAGSETRGAAWEGCFVVGLIAQPVAERCVALPWAHAWSGGRVAAKVLLRRAPMPPGQAGAGDSA